MSRLAVVCAALSLTACHGAGGGGTLTSDSTHFALCEIDANCPGGSYCQAGVCDGDCRSNADCGTGLSCDARARCSSGPVTPPTFAGKLSVSKDSLDFPIATRTATWRMQNDGATAIDHFHIISDDPAVSAIPSRGSLPAGQGLDVTVALQPDWVGHASLQVLSSGGMRVISVSSQSSLAGYLKGTIDVEGPFALGSADVALDLAPNLSGVVDGVGSLLWPFNSKVVATDDGTHASFKFSLVSRYGAHDFVQRDITLIGTHVGSGPVSGTYQETVTGLGATVVSLTGKFSLAGAGPTKGLVAQGMQTFQAPTVSPPLALEQCSAKDPSCPVDPGVRGAAQYALAFPFEQFGYGSKVVHGTQCQIGSSLQPVDCVDAQEAKLALGSLANSQIPATAWEVFRGLASGAQLLAKDAIATTLQPAQAAFTGPAVDATQLQAALGLLVDGLHENSGPGGLLTVSNLFRAQQWAPQPSQLDPNAGSDTHRFGGIVETELFAAGQVIDRLQRSGSAAIHTAAFAQEWATSALLDLAALATVNLDGTVQVMAAAPATLLGCATQFAGVANGFDRVRRGFNAVGYPDAYVPFLYDAQNPTQDLFQQLLSSAQNQVAVGTPLETALEQDTRDFESSSTSLQTAVDGTVAEASTQIVALCGAVDPVSTAGCGQASGKIFTDAQDIQAAVAALGGAKDAAANAVTKLQLLAQQQQSELAQQQSTDDVIADAGAVITEVAKAKAHEEMENLNWRCGTTIGNGVGQVLGGIVGLFTGNPASLVTGIFGGVSSSIQACEEAKNSQGDDARAANSANAQTSETQSQMQETNQIRNDTLLVEVADATAASEAAFSNSQQQVALLNAARGLLQSDFVTLAQLLANRSAEISVQQTDVDPTYRLYRDQAGMQWASQLEVARKWAFLAVRALEYTINASYAGEGDVLSAATVAQLNTLLGNLSDAYGTDQLANGWVQQQVDVVSLRRDVLGITSPIIDEVTGQTISPEAQFQAQISLPKNRDALGNLALAFNTDVQSQGLPIFSNQVCGDTIVDIKVNLVSSALTGQSALLDLTQAGVASLADCSTVGSFKSYTLSSKKALITAGLNLPLSAQSDPAYPANNDLYERPVVATSWMLGVDGADPRNAWLDLSKLDDIELWIHHAARTAQSH